MQWGKEARGLLAPTFGSSVEDALERPDLRSDEVDADPQEDEKEEELEEGAAVRTMRSPTEPTAKERADHDATHMPFRSWCAHCVEGRGESLPHLKSENTDITVPEISLDYCFTRKTEEERNVTILVMKDRQSRVIIGNLVLTKGRGMEDTVDRVVANVRRLGHRGQLIVKVDNEPALLDLREAAMEALAQTCVPIAPPPGEHQSNGGIENAVKLTKGMLRVHHRALEDKLGASVPSDHPIMGWLVEHVTDLISKYSVGKDGKTPYERLMGRKLREEMLMFGERVWYKRREQSGDLSSRWGGGVWVGRRWGSIANIIITEEGALEARNIRRRPDGEKWSKEVVENIRATPWCWRPRDDVPMVVLPPMLPSSTTPTPPAETAPVPVPLPPYITKEDLNKYGFTAGCRRCLFMREGRSIRGIKHTPACRIRLEQAMAEAGDRKVDRAANRRREYEEVIRRQHEVEEEAGAQGREALEQQDETLGANSEGPLQLDENAVPELPREQESHELGSQVWVRTDTRAVRFQTTRGRKNAPPWSRVTHRTTVDTDSGHILEDKVCVKGMTKEELTRQLPSPCSTQTILYCLPPESAEPMQLEQRTVEDQQQISYLMQLKWQNQGRQKLTPEMIDEMEGTLNLFLIGGCDQDDAIQKVVELYSPPRVTARISRRGAARIREGGTYDLLADKCGMRWDFTKAEHRQRARREIAELKPYIVIGSPPCTMFSQLQNLNKRHWSDAEWSARWTAARVHLQFCAQIYQDQLREGRHFLHEHPAWAKSWGLPEIQQITNRPEVVVVEMHQCQYGMTQRDSQGHIRPILKPTRWATSAIELAKLLSRKCPDRIGHNHLLLEDGRAKAAAIYPEKLCRIIRRGILRQIERERAGAPAYVQKRLDQGIAVVNLPRMLAHMGEPMQVEVEESKVLDEEEEKKKWMNTGDQHHADLVFWDDITGENLNPEEVRIAREEELNFMEDWEVWELVPISTCWSRTGKKPLGGRWVDHNKGDKKNPVVRCRWVAKDIAKYSTDEFYAATPPLEALRMLCSRSATKNKDEEEEKLLFIDVRKAHLHAMADRDIYVDLPPERAKPGYCAKLLRCLYGTRDAPARWEALYTEKLESLGFHRGLASASVFFHQGRNIRCVVHGDDFTFQGSRAQLEWIQARMEEVFLCKVEGIMGSGVGELKEARILNRVIRWGKDGIKYEADPRHVEYLVRDLSLGSTTPLSTPILRASGTAAPEARDSAVVEEVDEPLSEADAKMYRKNAARINYLSLDRADIGYAGKELCRHMTNPTSGNWLALIRVARYLMGAPRLVYDFRWQQSGKLLAYSDTDFAGCRLTRKSTSGGCLFLGNHLVKHWSTTQKVISLSSGEAELAGIVKGAAEAIGARSLAADLGLELSINLFSDASAAIGICRRTGIGRVRHLAVGQLWVQEKVRSGDIRLFKVAGSENPADLLTKALPRPAMDLHENYMGLTREEGRAASTPHISES